LYRRGSAVFVQGCQKPLARLENNFVGKIYEFIMQRIVLGTAGLLRSFDTRVIDYAIHGVGRLTRSISRILKSTVTGNVQHYALIMAVGALLLLALALFVL
jgi:NADH:ubiquinone oxidoreductase subunit 5 (subunit L)/multisubunit Na+/H+ antiporter MnhA subunit